MPDRLSDSARRQDEVERYRALGPRPEPDIDDLTSLAALACDTPIALVTIIGDGQQWYTSVLGIASAELPPRAAYWGEALLEGQTVVVSDTAADRRYAGDANHGSAHIRSFAAAPLRSGGVVVGALCVADRVPRALTARQLDGLRAVARQVMARMANRERTDVLSASEDQLFKVFRNCPVAISIHRWTDRVFVDVNPSFTALFGWTKEEVAGRTTTEIRLVDETAAAEKRALLVQSSEMRDEELIVRTRDGGTRHVLIGTALVDLYGERHAISTFIDITDRKLAEERTRASEARYRSLFDYAPDGIVIADEHGRYLDANASICRMLGYGREEVIGMSGADIVMPVEHQHLDAALTAIKASPDYNREWSFRRKDESTFRAEVMATQMPDGNVLAMIRDVTERSRADARFRRLVESNAQGVLFWDTNGAITGANDAFLHTVGYNREDLQTGQILLADISPPEYHDLDRRARHELAERGVCTPIEKEYIRKDGSRVPVMVGAAAFEDNPSEGMCFVLDLTDFKRMEQQLLRTQRLESIGTLAGGIAHDLNNVLTPLMLSVELLLEIADNAEATSILETMQGSVRHGADLVQQVLTFARGVQGRRILINPATPLRELFNVLRDTFPKTIALQVVPEPGLWSITGDPTQIHQVLLNLCVNARDAMPDGGTLTVTMANIVLDETFASMNLEARTGAYVATTVSDTGVGMTKDVQERIFEPFFTTKETGRGTGLGLSTSIAIVKSHGGFMNLYSEPGTGTTFNVYLPANTSEASGNDVPVEVAPLPRGGGELILVVDDEEAIRTIVKGTLERFGYRVMLAANGADAVELFARHRSDIAAVLTDMAMPVMDGAAAITALTALDPAVKIIGSSGLADADGIRRAMGARVQQFVKKPYSAERILTALREVLGNAAPADEASPP